MDPRRSATVAAAFYPAVIIAGWAVVSLVGIGSLRIETSGAAHVVDRLAPSLTASVELATAPQTAAMAYAAVDNADVATAAEFMAKPVTQTPAAAADLSTTDQNSRLGSESATEAILQHQNPAGFARLAEECVGAPCERTD